METYIMIMSKEKSKALAKIALDKLIDKAGSQVHLAKMLSQPGQSGDFEITPQGIQSWVKRNQISKEGAIAVVRNRELCEFFTLKSLRPDVSEAEWQELLSKQ